MSLHPHQIFHSESRDQSLGTVMNDECLRCHGYLRIGRYRNSSSVSESVSFIVWRVIKSELHEQCSALEDPVAYGDLLTSCLLKFSSRFT